MKIRDASSRAVSIVFSFLQTVRNILLSGHSHTVPDVPTAFHRPQGYSQEGQRNSPTKRPSRCQDE